MDKEQTADSEAEHVTLAAENLKHELMDMALGELRIAQEPWQKLGEEAQADVIERVEKRVKDAVRDCIRMISAHGFVRVPASLESLTVKDGIKAVASVSRLDPARYALIDAQGGIVTLVIADLSHFTDSQHGHKPDKDQGELALPGADEAGAGDAADPGADGAESGALALEAATEAAAASESAENAS